MVRHGFLAFDLGAESGRAMLGTLDGQRLTLDELHRFANLPQRLPSGYHWNLLDLWRNLTVGLKLGVEAARERNIQLISLGVDTWGVDFGLLGKSGQLLGLPFAYRDDRNPPAMQLAFDIIGKDAIYDATAIQFMPFNSLFQLVAQHKAEPSLLAQVEHMLWMPDLLHYFFSGKPVNEATIASTSQMLDPRTGLWVTGLMHRLGLPTRMLRDVVPAGTVIGLVRDELAQETGATGVKVIAPGSHDTASAVAAVPVDVSKTPDWAYLSSGTWSLMGAELDAPIINDASRKASFTNERGVGNKIRLLKNISGLWLVQQCRQDLQKRGQSFDYPQLTKLAGEAEPFRTLIDPDHAPFASPGDMLAKIAAFAEQTGQASPQSPGQFVRCCLESLALTYRLVLKNLQTILERRIDVLHIVGGGGQNTLLNQMTADAINRRVIVGPYEATAIGNALTQAIGAGIVRDLDHLRAIVRESFEPMTHEPQNATAYDRQFDRFTQLLGQ